MALQFSDILRNAMLDQIETVAGSAAKVVIYTGTAPANVAAAASGTVLATFTLPADWAGNAGATVQGRKDFVVPQTTTAVAAGTAGYFRIMTNGNVPHMQGTIGTTGADLNLDNTSIANGQSIQITSWQITAPGA
jgi:hypothetical protein